MSRIFLTLLSVMLCCFILCYSGFAETEDYCTSSETECTPQYAPALGRMELVCYEKCLKYRNKTENTSKKKSDDDKFPPTVKGY